MMPPCEGGFKEFSIYRLFDVPSCSKKISKKDAIDGGNIPIYSSDTTNNGIVGYCNLIPHWKVDNKIPRYLIFGDHTRSFNIAETDFCVADNVKVLIPKTVLSTEELLYIITLWKKNIPNLGYARHWSKAKDIKLTLPVNKNGEIDFHYMGSFVRSFKDCHIKEINDCLDSIGFEDWALTVAEKQALNNAILGKVSFTSRTISSLMNGQTGDVDIQNKDINGKGCYFINSGVTEFGIKGKTDRKAKTFAPNTITIDFFGNAYYRPFEYKLATHNHVFSYSGDCIKNETVGLYLVTQLGYLAKVYSYSNMGTMPKYNKHEIELPVDQNGNIDYSFMETYVRAIMKQTVGKLKASMAIDSKVQSD